MREIKQLDGNNKELFDVFYNFCIKSKPYDFCSLKSRLIRSFKIKEYYNEVAKNCRIYSCYEENDWLGFFFISYDKDDLTLDFVIGNSAYPDKVLIDVLHCTLLYLLKTLDKQYIKSIIQRKHKREKFINWIKRYDKSCEIDKDDNVIWTYERLSKNYRNKSDNEIITG